MNFMILLACLAAPFIVLRLLHFFPRKDDVIDGLIARNKARPREGMETIDWKKANKAGDRVWAEVLRGQRRRGAERADEGRVH